MGSKSKSKAKGNKKKQAKPVNKNAAPSSVEADASVNETVGKATELEEIPIDQPKPTVATTSDETPVVSEEAGRLNVESQAIEVAVQQGASSSSPGAPIKETKAETEVAAEPSKEAEAPLEKPSSSSVPDANATPLTEKASSEVPTLEKDPQKSVEEMLGSALDELSLNSDSQEHEVKTPVHEDKELVSPIQHASDEINGSNLDSQVELGSEHEVKPVDSQPLADPVPETVVESKAEPLEPVSDPVSKPLTEPVSGAADEEHFSGEIPQETAKDEEVEEGLSDSDKEEDDFFEKLTSPPVEKPSLETSHAVEEAALSPGPETFDNDEESDGFYASLRQDEEQHDQDISATTDLPTSKVDEPEPAIDSEVPHETEPIENEEEPVSDDEGDEDFFKALTADKKEAPKAETEKPQGFQLDLDDDDDFLDDDEKPSVAQPEKPTSNDAGALAFLDSDEDLLPDDEEPAPVPVMPEPTPSLRPRPSIAEFHTEQKSFDLPMEILPQQKARHQAPRVISRTGTPQMPVPTSPRTFSAPPMQDISPRTSTVPKPPPAFSRTAIRPSRAASSKSKYAPSDPGTNSQAPVPNPLNPPPPNPFSQSGMPSPAGANQFQQPQQQPQFMAQQQVPPQQKKQAFVRASNPDPFGFPGLPSSAVPKRNVRAAPSRDSLHSATPPVVAQVPQAAPPLARSIPVASPPVSVPPPFVASQRKNSVPQRAKSSTGGKQNYAINPAASVAPQMMSRAHSFTSAPGAEQIASQSTPMLPYPSQDYAAPPGVIPTPHKLEPPQHTASSIGNAPPQREISSGVMTPQPLYDSNAAFSVPQASTEGFPWSSETNFPPAATINKLPLPLLGPKGLLKNKTKDVEKWIEERTSQMGMSSGALLYKVMKLLGSTDEAGKGQSMRDLLQDHRRDFPFQSVDAQPSMSSGEVSSLIFGKLMSQDRMQALQAALDSRAYSHALLIAKSLGSQQWQTAVEEFVAEEARKAAAPLAFVYRALAADSVEAGASAISELKPRGETSHLDVNKVDAQLIHWAGCVSALYDSVASSGENSPPAAALKELGKLLVERDFVEEGHVCFAICKVSLGSLPEFSLPLVTEQKPPQFDSYVLAEIYESILGRGSPVLLPRKIEFASTLANMGFKSEALRIAETVAQVLKATKGAPQPLVEAANALVEGCSVTTSPSGGWLNRKLSKPQFGKAFNKFVSGDDEETPAQDPRSKEHRHSLDSAGMPTTTNIGFVPPPRHSFTPGPDIRSTSPGIAVQHSRPKSSAASRHTTLAEVAEEYGSQTDLGYPSRSSYTTSGSQQQSHRQSPHQQLESPYAGASAPQFSSEQPYGVQRRSPMPAQLVNEPPQLTPAAALQNPLQSVSPAFSEAAQAPSLYQADSQAPPLMMPSSTGAAPDSVFADPTPSSIYGLNPQYPSEQQPPAQYSPVQNLPGQQSQGQYPQGQYPQGQYPQQQYPQGQFIPGSSGQYPANQYAPAQPGQYPPGQDTFGQQGYGYQQMGQPPLANASAGEASIMNDPYAVGASPSFSPQIGMAVPQSGMQNYAPANTMPAGSAPPQTAGKYDPVYEQPAPTVQPQMQAPQPGAPQPAPPVPSTMEAPPEKKDEKAGNTKAGKQEDDGTKKKGWFSWLKKEENATNEPIKVKLGGNAQMYFDKELGRWVSKDGPRPEPKKGPPPPPKAAMVSAPANTAPPGTAAPNLAAIPQAGMAPPGAAPPGAAPPGMPSSASPPGAAGPSISTSPPGAAPPALSSGGIDGILAAATAGKGKRRPARSRYVGTAANGMPQGL